MPLHACRSHRRLQNLGVTLGVTLGIFLGVTLGTTLGVTLALDREKMQVGHLSP